MNISDKLRFEVCIKEELSVDRSLGENIGTYKEKRLHRIIKNFFEPDITKHEQSVGDYVADILREDEIIEVQSGSFYPLRDKIKYYLEKTDYSVTVVRPLPHIKWCVWLEEESGEVVSKKKSPKKFLPKDVLRDWIYLCEYLENKRLKIIFLLLEEEEYRFLGKYGKNRKLHSKRYERFPISLIDDVCFCGAEDYKSFLPPELPRSFIASQYMELSGLRSYGAYAALKLLCRLGFIQKTDEKSGRSFVYKRTG